MVDGRWSVLLMPTLSQLVRFFSIHTFNRKPKMAKPIRMEGWKDGRTTNPRPASSSSIHPSYHSLFCLSSLATSHVRQPATVHPFLRRQVVMWKQGKAVSAHYLSLFCFLRQSKQIALWSSVGIPFDILCIA